NGQSTTATANVSVSADASTLVVSPYQAQVAGGQAVRFQAEAWDQYGNRVTVSPTWSVAGGGTIDNTGLFTGSTMGGPYTVTAVAGLLSATGSVWVTSQAAAVPPAITAQPTKPDAFARDRAGLHCAAIWTRARACPWSH